MSRHRNVRTMDYSEEYDGFDDVYGHSVEDDYCISPSDAAQFMFDRTKQPQMSAFFSEENDIAEEDESNVDGSKDFSRRDSDNYQRPGLSEEDDARLRSCLDEIRNVIGDSVPEHILIDTVLKNDFNFNKALDAVLSNAANTVDKTAAGAPKPQRERRNRDRDDECNDSESVSSLPQFSVFSSISNSEVQGLRDKVEKLEIKDEFVTSKDSQNVHSQQSLSNLSHLRDNSTNIPVAAFNKVDFYPIYSRTVPSSDQDACSDSRSCRQLGIHNINLCVQKPLANLMSSACQNVSSSGLLVSSSGKQVFDKVSKSKISSNESSPKLNIPKLKMKVRNDSEKENFTEENDNVSTVKLMDLQSQGKTKEYDSPLDLTFDDDGLLELQPLDECVHFSSLTQLAGKHSAKLQYSTLVEHGNMDLKKLNTEQETGSFSSLAELASRNSQKQATQETGCVSSLAELANTNLQKQEAQETGYVSSLVQLANRNSQKLQAAEETSHASSLAELSSKQLTEQLEEDSQLSSLAELAKKCSLSVLESQSPKKETVVSFIEPATARVRKLELQSLDGIHFSSLSTENLTEMESPEGDTNFSSLAGLANKHSKSSETKLQSSCHFSSLTELATKHQHVNKQDQISSLSELASQHLRIFEMNNSDPCVKAMMKSKRTQSDSTGELDLTTCLVSSTDHNTLLSRQESDVKMDTLTHTVSEMLNEDMQDYESTSIESNSNISTAESSLAIRSVSEEADVDWEIDLTCALTSPSSRSSKTTLKSKPVLTDWNLHGLELEISDEIPEFKLDFDVSLKIVNQILPLRKKIPSPFGRILCRKWKPLSIPYTTTTPRKQSIGKIIHFPFTTPSPDDKINFIRRK
ncbi:uro-adherence factor A isoform X1 [Periplaneta americana]|uniref:uro-adherence factor A isoform X1 n=1 Tax=Periplaneta americana TaxID=6978 RepID=UPI0037E8DBD0